MKFNRLRLTNIGAFHGNYDFNLTTMDQKRNVILVGGQNGSGKTTILESIRLALFGPLSFGYKTETATYFEKIDSRLNTSAKKTGELLFQIILDFEMVEHLQRNSYTLKRSWERSKSSFKEQLMIQRNGKFLNEREIEIFLTKLREETPPQLFEFCLFDGERITQIISDENLSLYLRDTAKAMFNLDLFENLENDLKNLIKQDSIYGSLSQEEKQLHETEKYVDDLKRRYQTLLQEQSNREARLEEMQSELATRNKEFEVHGGLVKEKRDALLQKMNVLEQRRGVIMEKNKDNISTLLPFVLIKDLIVETTEQMNNESVLDVRNNVQRLINSEQIKIMLETRNIQLHAGTPIDQTAHEIFAGLLGLLSTDADTIYHHASFQQRLEVEKLHQQVQNFDPREILDIYRQNTDMLHQAAKIRKKIDENEADDLRLMLDTIHRLKNEIDSIQLQQEQQLVILSELSQEITEKAAELDALKSKIVRARKAENVFVISNKVLEISQKFRSLQIKKKLQQVEWETANMLRSLFRKELFVVRVSIDPETFQLRIYNSANEEVRKENLSAGEKQILLLSSVWAMIQCSNRRLPFVFDTLFGRLDQTHRKSIIQNLIPRCGEQVIILSTDSEIDQDLYKLIEPIVAKTYTIDYNTAISTVDLSDRYFTFSGQEV